MINRLDDAVEDIKKGPVKKAQKDKISGIVCALKNTVDSNMHFLRKCQHKKLEKMVTDAAAEAEALISNIVKSAGIKALKTKGTKLLK